MKAKTGLSKKWKILITPKEAAESLGSLPSSVFRNIDIELTHGRLEDPKKLKSFLSDKDAVVLELERITSETLKHCRKLKIISRFGEGYDNIDLKGLRRSGVRLARTRAVSSTAVARHVMALILAMTHRVTDNDRDIKNGLWLRRPNISDGNMVLGIVGLGKIGSRVADLASEFGLRVLAYDIRNVRSRHSLVRSLGELIMLSDIITLHVPLTEYTRNMISKDVIKELKGKYLVNAARGGIVDEAAMLKSLERGLAAGYAADTYLCEPISGISEKLTKHPKTVCSPHIAALDKVTAVDTTRRAIENAVHCLEERHAKVISYVI